MIDPSVSYPSTQCSAAAETEQGQDFGMKITDILIWFLHITVLLRPKKMHVQTSFRKCAREHSALKLRFLQQKLHGYSYRQESTVVVLIIGEDYWWVKF